VRFEEQVRVIWRQRLWLIGASLLAAIVVFIAVSLRDTSYTTSAVIGVTPGPVIAGNAVAVDTVSFTASRYQRLVGSDAVLTSGAAVADKGTTLQDMRERVSASTPVGSGTVTVTVRGSSADETARVAAAVANATITQGRADQEKQRDDSLTALRTERDTLRTQLDAMAADAPERSQVQAEYQSVVSDIATQQSAPFDAAQLLQTPEVPKAPTGPGAKSLALFAFLAVLIIGAEGIVLWTRRQQRNAQAAEAEEAEAAPAPVTLSLEEVPSFMGTAEPVAEEVADDPAAHVPLLPLVEVSDAIITSALEGHRLIAVIGSGDLPATNDVSLALGQELAEQGLSTLVVEGDMSRPTMASRLSIRSQAGLTDVLSGGSSLERTLRQTTVNGLNILPSGRAVDRPDVLIGVDNVQRVLSTSSTDIVLVTLPPSMRAAERDAIAGQLHGVVLMVRDGRMRDRQVRGALQDLGHLNNILMAVGLVDIVPNPELEIVGRRSPRRATPAKEVRPDPIRDDEVRDDEVRDDEVRDDEVRDEEVRDGVRTADAPLDAEEPPAADPDAERQEPSANGHYEHIEDASFDELPHA
jgi:Mrp family chromosome partitioning ATPase/capsular polysaccharide biosynthesis protein